MGVEKVQFPPKQSKFEDRKCPENSESPLWGILAQFYFREFRGRDFFNTHRRLHSMYGPPPDCKRFEVERRDSLRKCIRPLKRRIALRASEAREACCTSRLFYLSYGPVPAAGSLGSPSRNHQGARSHPPYLKRSSCWNGRGEPPRPFIDSHCPPLPPIFPPLTSRRLATLVAQPVTIRLPLVSKI